nr:MAG TPA: hypothetical protein [Caudoviricetes sp.]
MICRDREKPCPNRTRLSYFSSQAVSVQPLYVDTVHGFPFTLRKRPSMERLIWRKPEEMAAALASVGSIPKSAVCCLAQSVRLVTTTGSPSGVRRCQILAFRFCGPRWPSGNASAASVPWARLPVLSAAAAAFLLAAALHLLCRPLCCWLRHAAEQAGEQVRLLLDGGVSNSTPQITHFRIISVCGYPHGARRL